MRKRLIIAAIALQFLVLLGMAGRREWILRTGKVIGVETAPLDPLDPMRGEYVALRYDFSDVPIDRSRGNLRTRPSRLGENHSWKDLIVYGTLRPDAGGLMQMETVSEDRPRDGQFLMGRVQQLSSSGISVRWGIESLFLEQGRSQALESTRTKEKAGVPFYIDVALSNGGEGIIKGYRWGDCGISIDFDREPSRVPLAAGQRNRPTVIVGATVEIRNVSIASITLADLPDQQSFRLVPSEWSAFSGAGSPGYVWLRRDMPRPVVTPADLRVLRPGETWRTRIDFRQASWLLQKQLPAGASGSPVSLADLEDKPDVGFFRIVYDPPPPGPGSASYRYIRLRSRQFTQGRID